MDTRKVSKHITSAELIAENIVEQVESSDLEASLHGIAHIFE